MKYWFFLAFVSFFQAQSQELVPSFSIHVESRLCIGTSVSITNTSTAAEKTYWDFCPVSFSETPQISNFLGTNNASGYGYKLVEENGQWFGFLINRNSSKLMRLDFGTDPLSMPTMTDLGNPGGLFSAPDGLELFKEGANWYALTGKGDNGSGQIIRLSFGADLRSIPSAVGLGTFGFDGTRARDLKVVKQDQDLVLLLLGYGTNSIHRVNYGNSILNTPLSQSSVVIPGANLPIGFTISRFDQWKIHVLSENSLVQQLDFAEDITGPMTVDGSFNFLFTDTPFGIQSVYTNGKNHVIIAGAPKYNVVDFGDLSLNQAPTPIASGNAFFFSFAIKKLEGKLLMQGPAISEIASVVYRNNCDASVQFSESLNPDAFTYGATGSKLIDLTLSDGVNQKSQSHALVIKNFQAPIVNILTDDVCAQAPIPFSHTSDQSLMSSFWLFGDTQTSTDASPVHDYSAPGDYRVRLEVESVNGCHNFAEKPIKIYDSPVSSFTLPSSPLCTNTEIVITNTTLDNFDGNLSYEWYVDDDRVSDMRDLVSKFTDLGSRTIKLITSIPGCSSQSSQITSPVLAGPVVDFSSSGICEQDFVQFTSIINENVDARTWDFDDGNISSDVNPAHIFDEEGTYSVSLTALSPNGCENKKIRLIAINEKPLTDFSIASPPSSCSGSVSQFADLTTGVIEGALESWHWNFADGSTDTNQNPSHIFQNAGEYNVEFTVTTDAGCSNSIIKPITILQSPTINFTNGPSCPNAPTNFTASSDGVLYYWEIGTSYYETKNASHVFNRAGTHAVRLNVVGSNDCISTMTRNVIVPVPVNPVFSFANNCRGNETRFTSTSGTADPVITRSWNFAGEGASAEANPSFIFKSIGNKPITLQVVTAAGCVYQSLGSVNVIEPPVANFAFTPDFGVPPQEISFFNSSTNATSFNWNFGDGNVSIEMSPKHTFNQLGQFEVALTATNNAACQSSATKVVSMVAPLPDVDLNLMTLSTNPDGTLKVIITIANRGNTIVRNLPVRLDVSGQVTLETIVTENITPFSMYNLVLNYTIAQTSGLEFLCASTSLEGDLHPEGNRICNQLKSELAIIKPYPNPVTDLLTVEWVAQGGEEVELNLVDTRGQTVLTNRDISASGLNQKTLDLQNVRSGVYILRILAPTSSQTHRILVSNQN